MPVYLTNATRRTGLDFAAVERTVTELLAALDERDSSISVSFVRDPAIRELNRTYRGADKPTDVLSFPLVEAGDAYAGAERLLGDVVISVDTARRQAADYDAPLDREVQRLLIHGVLHLLGHDHVQSDERVRMEAEERRLADRIGMPWPY
ncbi:MAG: rRNA maturation RNase YbeY [Candidatus Velthaea sp.]